VTIGQDPSGPPTPDPSERTRPFWEHATQGRLAFQQCNYCGAFAHPPVDFCGQCHQVDKPAFTFTPVSGTGRIVNWTVIHDAVVRGFGPDPWIHVLVRLDEQTDLLYAATLESHVDREPSLGARVRAIFPRVAPNIGLPTFVFEN
jgi:uncharacterized OB-fold protein